MIGVIETLGSSIFRSHRLTNNALAHCFGEQLYPIR
jgi:hypothetical protein